VPPSGGRRKFSVRGPLRIGTGSGRYRLVTTRLLAQSLGSNSQTVSTMLDAPPEALPPPNVMTVTRVRTKCAP
jgi:hypothetical protein